MAKDLMFSTDHFPSIVSQILFSQLLTINQAKGLGFSSTTCSSCPFRSSFATKTILLFMLIQFYSVNNRRKLHLDSITSMNPTQSHLSNLSDSRLPHITYPTIYWEILYLQPQFSLWSTRRLCTHLYPVPIVFVTLEMQA